jgi:hypothetical protein
MSRSVVLILLVALVALSFAPKVAAFGAGNIPSYSHLEDRAFRHGDIEDIIEKRESFSPTLSARPETCDQTSFALHSLTPSLSESPPYFSFPTRRETVLWQPLSLDLRFGRHKLSFRPEEIEPSEL